MPELSQNPRISVIVPVYNVENYVAQCLYTLTHQHTQLPFEVITVNDGSRDGSLRILRREAAKTPVLRVIDQPNAGVSAARMAGLRAARGAYICFVDGDDYVSANYLEHLYRACTQNDAEIACCYYYWHMVKTDVLCEYPFRNEGGVYDRATALNMLLRDVEIQSFLWGKMFRRDLLDGIVFPNMCFEDLAVLHRVFARAKQTVILNEPLYFYNMHSDSTLGTISAKKVNDYIRAIAMVRIALQKSGHYALYRDSYRSLCKKTCGCCLYFLGKLHQKGEPGLLQDTRRVIRAINHYKADDFSDTALFTDLPDVIAQPSPRRSRRTAPYPRAVR